jgi:hypothetical protein
MRTGKRPSNNQPPARALADEEVLTQYGSSTNPTPDGPFRQTPREKDEGSVSLMIGHCTPTQASLAIGHLRALEGDGARYTTVAALRGAGFTVTHTPSRSNPDHVSVAARTEWTKELGQEFANGFKQVQWLGEQGGS